MTDYRIKLTRLIIKVYTIHLVDEADVDGYHEILYVTTDREAAYEYANKWNAYYENKVINYSMYHIYVTEHEVVATVPMDRDPLKGREI